MENLRSWLILARTPGLHSALLVPMLARFGNVATLVAADPASLMEAGLRTEAVNWLTSPDERLLDLDCRWLEQGQHHFIAWDSPSYPPLLAEIADAPIGLYVDGNPDCLSWPQLAMVGSRNPTHAGIETASAFAAHLARSGLIITSGLAAGIDASSHRGALAADGNTIAVCGTGLDSVYPAEHQELAREIALHGALVSEFPCGTAPVKTNFPRRNRLISGLSLGTLVVEAALRSGSLITARLAAAQGREVFAIPGSIHSPLARGCHQLLKTGAKLVESADDIFSELHALVGLLRQDTATAKRPKDPDSAAISGSALDKDYKILLDALGFEPAGVDVLAKRTGFKAGEVASMLLILELDGRIESFPGGLYVRTHP